MSTEIHALSGAYAVDALDEEERAEFERHLAGCQACQAEVDGLREAAATLGELSVTEPPTGLRDRVLADISVVRPLPPATERAARPASAVRRRRWAAVIAAAAAVVAIVGAGVAWHPWHHDTGPALSAVARVQHAPDARRYTASLPGGARVTVYRSVSLDRAAVITRGLASVPAGKVYELWLQDAHGSMRPAGLLPRTADAARVLTGAAATATGVGITVEPAGGSTAPTSTPVALVALA